MLQRLCPKLVCPMQARPLMLACRLQALLRLHQQVWPPHLVLQGLLLARWWPCSAIAHFEKRALV